MTVIATLGQLADTFAGRRGQPALQIFGRSGVKTVDYGTLHSDLNQMARRLRQVGVEPGSMVLLWAPNSAAWIAAYFGILQCGATVIPLDAQAPTERAAAVLQHSGARVAVTTAAQAAALQDAAAVPALYCLLVDAPAGDPRDWRAAAEAGTPAGRATDPEQVASLLYTSGTTGTPKAVPLTHANFAANVTALLGAKLLAPTDVVVVPLPFHHVYPFTVGLLTVLASGACLVLPSGISGPEITRALEESRATALIAVPRLCTAIWEGIARGVQARGKLAQRLFRVLLGLSGGLRRWTGIRLGTLLFSALHKRIGGALRTIGCGGAQLDPDIARKLEALGFTVLTGYGLTETSPVLTFNRHRHRKLGTEGVPLPGVDVQTRPQAGYEHGEIVARGANVFAGYWNNPDETRAAFTEDGWFRTGDLGWLDKRGFLHIAGRSKEVIVLPDGKNIFPDEIEAEFDSSTLLAEIAVLERDGRLHALIVPDEHALRDRGAHRLEQLLKDEIAEVAQRLPPYQRLSDYRITLVPLPRTPLGKLRRHLLNEAFEAAASRKVARTTETLSDDDRKLLEAEPAKTVWAWLQTRYPDAALTLETSPQLDLNIDSLEWVTVTLELERQFAVSLDGEAVSRIVTVRDLLREVQAAPARAAGAGTAPSRNVEPPPALLRGIGTLLLGINRLLMRGMFRVEARGVDTLPQPGTPLLIAPNHVSYLDPLAVAAALPRHYLRHVHWAGWVGKMYAGPVSRLVSRATRVFPVEPDRDAGGAIALGLGVLAESEILVWFPEGGRSFDGTLQPFQTGIGLLIERGAPVAVPTAIFGAFEAWPRQSKYPQRGKVEVVFGTPLTRDELIATGNGASDAERITNALHAAVADLIARYTRNPS
jgi:long-chain acyl-CoA synthetase